MVVENKPTEGNKKYVRRLIEFTVIGASCVYLGVRAIKKFSTP